MSQYVMAIDAGTGSLRAIIFDATGAQVAVTQTPWQHLSEPGVPGSMGFDFTRNRQLAIDVIAGALHEAGVYGSDIAAVAGTSMREGIVCLDSNGREVWGCANVDSRASEQVGKLKQDSDLEKAIYAKTGEMFALAAQPRLMWLAENRPELFARVDRVIMISEWIALVLSGAVVMEPTNGSTSGLVSLASRKTDPKLLELCGLPTNLLPEVVEPGTVVGKVSAEMAASTGLSESTSVVAGGGDAQLAALGTGVVAPGQALVVGGTFWQELANIASPMTDPLGSTRVNAAATPDVWQAEAISFHVGTSIRWFRDSFCHEEAEVAAARGGTVFDVLNERAAQVAPGSAGILPIFSDVMNFASWRHAAPSFLNLSLDMSGAELRASMYRSLLENAAVVAKANLDAVSRFTDAEMADIAFAGGSSRSELWCQIVADALGKSIRVPVVSEATALGAAMCAATGAGWFSSLKEASATWSETARVYEPNLQLTSAYQELFDNWQAAYQKQLELAEVSRKQGETCSTRNWVTSNTASANTVLATWSADPAPTLGLCSFVPATRPRTTTTRNSKRPSSRLRAKQPCGSIARTSTPCAQVICIARNPARCTTS